MLLPTTSRVMRSRKQSTQKAFNFGACATRSERAQTGEVLVRDALASLAGPYTAALESCANTIGTRMAGQARPADQADEKSSLFEGSLNFAAIVVTVSPPLAGLVAKCRARGAATCQEASMPTIALIDDDRNILTSVSIALEAEGYRTTTYTDGSSALDAFKSSPPDLAILDIKMPRMDGMEMLRRLRQMSDVPVIFLTSKDEEIDELFGLKMGADDFIRKPFSQRLLVERVKAVLRRSGGKDGTVPKETDTAKVLERGQLRMDPERHTCTWKNEPVTLTVTEFLILQALATRPGVVKSRNALMDAAYDDQVYVDDRTIDSHIKRLRKKFKQAEDSFDMIETLYGVGYRFKE